MNIKIHRGLEQIGGCIISQNEKENLVQVVL